MRKFLAYLFAKWNYLKGHSAFEKSSITTIIRIAIWSVYCIFKRPATISLGHSGAKFYLPPKFKEAGSTGIYVLREDYEPELKYLNNVLQPGRVFVDVGANFGVYTVIASKLVADTGKVLAFEPAAETYPILDRNVEINNFSNVKVFHAAVSDKTGTSRFYHVNNAPNSYSLGADTESTSFEEVATVTLEDVFQKEAIERFDLMKVDVEGAEELVLRGSQSLIKKMRPQIIFEASADRAKMLGLTTDGAWNLLKEWGYEFFAIEKTGKLKPLNSIKFGNILAIPRAC
ncbi:FkbM family methyltransferase [Calothrix sp. NIES-2098]|uniref:FkbM family methyltransferase n=1 Tax=Calothrix sp. NIES-2098 TaxID=1954171 RepID=UPI000B61F3CB|nr:methyltransferase FkbM family protein [Calothrix sp. NIES-2098]